MKHKILTAILCSLICSSSIWAQNSELKRLIREDLILLNEVYSSQIVSNKKRQLVIGGGNSSNKTNQIIPSDKLESNSCVIINSIDTLGVSLFKVNVSFNLLFSDLYGLHKFDYLLYKTYSSDSIYFRIDGFFVNDIFLLTPNDLEMISVYEKKFKKVNKYYYKKNRELKCKKYFSSSIMLRLHRDLPKFDIYPVFNTSGFGYRYRVE